MLKTSLLLLLASCAVEDLSTDTQDLLGGTPTTARPEVGLYFPNYNAGLYCTATLISPTTFVTAARCIGFLPYEPTPTGASITWGNGQVSTVTRTFAQGTSNDFHDSDLAVGELSAPVSGITPATISTVEPVDQLLTQIGYGCTTAAVGCTAYQRTAYSHVWDNGYAGSIDELRDQGGPLFFGGVTANGAIARIALGVDLGRDVYADPVANRAQIAALSTSLQTTGVVSYRTYSNAFGWWATSMNAAPNPSGHGDGATALQVWTDGRNANESVCYSVLISGVWTSTSCNGGLVGGIRTQGQTQPAMQAIKIDRKSGPTQFPVRYRVYSHSSGWGSWYTNNQVAGFIGDALEQIQIEFPAQVIIPPGGGCLSCLN